MKIQKNIVTKDLAFSIDIQSLSPKTHSICDAFPEVTNDIIREGLAVMESRFKTLETIIRSGDVIEGAAPRVED